MKQLLFIAIMCLCFGFVHAQTGDEAEAYIHRETSDTIDFGECYKGDTIEAVFKFTVKGKGKLFIRQVYAGCQCTIPQYPSDTLSAGATDSVCLQFHSRNIHPGPVDKFAIVINSGMERTFRMVGIVKPLPVSGAIANKRIRLKTTH